MMRNSNQIITVHDELLVELFNLDRENIKLKMIYGIPYLLNYYMTNKVVIGFKTQISDYEYELFTNGEISMNELIERYTNYILLANDEKYILMILLDNYMKCKNKITISTNQIEKEYRSKCIKYRNIVLNEKTINKYIDIFNRLKMKELYIKTSDKFRGSNYGANGLELEQQLIAINSWNRIKAKDIEISYSLGMYGKIIKNCKRHSPTIIPRTMYYLDFSQIKLFLIATFIGRHIYVGRYQLKNRFSNGIYTEIDINEVYEFVEDRTKAVKSNLNRHRYYIKENTIKILNKLKHYGSIYDFEVYDEVIRIIYYEPPKSYYIKLS